jgi:hypothetical protein
MKSENQAVVWIADACCLILAVGLSYYLIRSWKCGVITTPARFARDVSRIDNPGMYWFAMLIWLVFDLFAIGCLLFRVYVFFKPAA